MIVAVVLSIADLSLQPSWSLGEFRLRPLRADDAPAWLAYLSDPRVIEHTSFPALDLSAVEAMLAAQLEGHATATSCRWAIADGSDRLLGTCGFSNWSLPHAHAELVYDLAPEFWGRGLMRAAVDRVLSWAFITARFNRVHAFVMTSNAPSIRLLESFRFTREGTMQQYRIARGVARDFYVYALLSAAAGNVVGAPSNSTVQPTPTRAT
ncbi:MAG: GNAT family N-acetyltransferase [Thermoanaerobaculia bacterium]